MGKQIRHGITWYLRNVRTYAEQANQTGLISVSVENAEVIITPPKGCRYGILFRDINTDEKLNRKIERISIEKDAEVELRKFCREGLMVGHDKFPHYFDDK